MKGAELAAAIAFERQWDERMRGLETRVDREYLGYAAGRILEAGVTREDLRAYFAALLEYDGAEKVPPS